MISIKDKIRDIFIKEDEIKRKELPQRLGIDPRNLGREIKSFLESGELTQRKDGKEIIYIAVKQTAQESNTEPLTEAQTNNPNPAKKKRKTKADILYDIIKSKKRPCSRQELRAETGLSEKNFDRRMKKNLQQGKVEKNKVGKNAYYQISGNSVQPITPVQSITKIDSEVARIPPLQAFLKYLEGERYSEKSIKEYKRIIVTFYKFKSNTRVFPIEQFTIRDTDGFRQYLHDKQQSESAIRHAMVALKSYFKYLKSRNYIINDFLADYKFPPIEPKEQPITTIEEWWQFVRSTTKNKHKMRDLAVLLLLFDTGLRISEIETICKEHINFNVSEIKILGAKGKRMEGGKIPRLLPISQITLNYLQKVIEGNKSDVTISYRLANGTIESGTAVFLNDQAQHAEKMSMKKRKVRDFIKRLYEQCKLRRITIHSFRRFLILILTNNGMRVDFVADRVGQKSEHRQTIAYINAAPEYKAEYTRQYHQAHPLNDPGFVRKFNTIVEGTA